MGHEASCPFCGVALGSADAPLLAAVIGLGLAACGPTVDTPQSDSGSTSSGTTDVHTSVQSTSPQSTSSSPSTTAGDPTGSITTSVDPSTGIGEVSTTDFDDCGDGCCGFYGGCPPDGGSSLECDVWTQDCPEGLKCMPWANDGGNAWNSTKCAPLDPNPHQVGDPCMVEGSGVSGIDDCGISAMCWSVDPDTNTGTCVGFCQGSEANPTCPDPGDFCTISNDGVLILCLPQCSPLVPSCGDDEVCGPATDNFTCIPGGANVPYGEPCEGINDCSDGLTCTQAAFVPACAGEACCTSFCDTTLGAEQCPEADAGETCEPWFAEGEAPAGLETLGVCIVI
jgi:hypothetical protein